MTAPNLNAGFTNNDNVITIRGNEGSIVKYTDRAIDLDGDGSKEKVTITEVTTHTDANGATITKDVYTTPSGVARSIIEKIVETTNFTPKGSLFTNGAN